MAWTTPRTWTPLEFVTAALLNTHLSDNLTLLKTNIDNSGWLKFQPLGVGYVSTGVSQNSNSGAGETDLADYQFTMPAGQLTTGDSFRIIAGCALAANTNAKTVRLDLKSGQKNTLLTTAVNVAANTGMIDCRVTWRSNTAAALEGWFTCDASNGVTWASTVLINSAYASLDWSGATTLVKITAQGGASSDIIMSDTAIVYYRGNGQQGT